MGGGLKLLALGAAVVGVLILLSMRETQPTTVVTIRDGCKVSDWSNWSDCGDSRKYRTRTVTNDVAETNCPPLREEESCEHDIDCAVSEFGEWEACDCEKEVRYRLRNITTKMSGKGAPCPSLIETTECECPKEYDELGYTSFMGAKDLDWVSMQGRNDPAVCRQSCTDYGDDCKGIVWRDNFACVGCLSDTCLKPTKEPSQYGVYMGWRKK